MTAAGPLAVLGRVRAAPRPAPGERCEMCGEPVAAEHGHVVNVAGRSLLCTCRGCYLLFTAEDAALAYRAVPDRYLSFGNLVVSPGQWDALGIPVSVAFFFLNSTQQRMVAFYPGPAGATESELPLEAMAEVLAANPQLQVLRPDVEALLVRAAGDRVSCFLVPVDRCYELAGRLRRLWRGFDGGEQARAALEEFFATVAARARPAGPGGSPP